jgi:hypothetical protein
MKEGENKTLLLSAIWTGVDWPESGWAACGCRRLDLVTSVAVLAQNDYVIGVRHLISFPLARPPRRGLDGGKAQPLRARGHRDSQGTKTQQN